MDRQSLFISNFKEIAIFIIKLFVMLFIVVFFLGHLSPQYLESYQASLIDKMARLESIDEPKIVLIGNSNLAFGINSEEIEEAFEMPVVNMGLHGGLGNIFHERMALSDVSEGDIYIICHSSYSDDGTISDRDLAWITIEDHFDLWKILRFEDIKPMFEAYPVYVKKCISLWLTDSGNCDSGDVYSRTAFNEYGDIEWEDNGLECSMAAGSIEVSEISDNVVQRLNELNEYLRERGATLLLAGYPIADTFDRPVDEKYDLFQKELMEKMEVPVISNYLDYVYPVDYFYNTRFHLNNEGKEIRTRQLIEDLQMYLSGRV